MPLCKRKCVPVVSLNPECRSAVCRMCPFSEELYNMLMLNCRVGFAQWGRWEPSLCHLARLLLKVEDLCTNGGTGVFLNLQRTYSLIVEGRENLKFILTPWGNLWLSSRLVNDEIQTLYQMYLPSIRQKFLSFCKLLVWSFWFLSWNSYFTSSWINAESLDWI